MRVKCVDDTSSCFVYCGELKKGKEYEVLESRSKMYLLNNDLGYEKWYYEYRFEIIKEDKMENRIVRKLEDLDGLENGMGLKVSFGAKGGFAREIILRVNGNEFATSNQDLVGACNLLKAMGFKFQYKPKRTKEEVLAEMRLKCKEFEFECENYFIRYDEKDKKYYIAYDATANVIGAFYFYERDAIRYCDELNEIIGVGK